MRSPTLPGPRRILLLFALVAVLGLGSAFFLIAPADAGPTPGTHVDIFSTPDCCNPIGFRHYDCEGNLTTQWGQQTGACYQSGTYGCDEN